MPESTNIDIRIDAVFKRLDDIDARLAQPSQLEQDRTQLQYLASSIASLQRSVAALETQPQPDVAAIAAKAVEDARKGFAGQLRAEVKRQVQTASEATWTATGTILRNQRTEIDGEVSGKVKSVVDQSRGAEQAALSSAEAAERFLLLAAGEYSDRQVKAVVQGATRVCRGEIDSINASLGRIPVALSELTAGSAYPSPASLLRRALTAPQQSAIALIEDKIARAERDSTAVFNKALSELERCRRIGGHWLDLAQSLKSGHLPRSTGEDSHAYQHACSILIAARTLPSVDLSTISEQIEIRVMRGLSDLDAYQSEDFKRLQATRSLAIKGQSAELWSKAVSLPNEDLKKVAVEKGSRLFEEYRQLRDDYRAQHGTRSDRPKQAGKKQRKPITPERQAFLDSLRNDPNAREITE